MRKLCFLGTAVLLAVTAALALGAAGGVGAQADAPVWSLVDAGLPAGLDLQGVYMTDGLNGAWIAAADHHGGRVIRLQRANGQWSADLGPTFRAPVRAVVAPSDTNVWAVGDAGLILHRDGSGWHEMSSPVPGANLTTIQMFGSGTEGWAAGAVTTGDGTAAVMLHYLGGTWQQDTAFSGPSTPKSLHFAGGGGFAMGSGAAWRYGNGHWVAENVPCLGGGLGCGTQLAAVRAIDSNDAWAVGRQQASGGGPTWPARLVLHRVGGQWQDALAGGAPAGDPLAAGPSARAGSWLNGLSFADATHGLAVGAQQFGRFGGYAAPYALSYQPDGRWHYETLPYVEGSLNAVSHADATHALAVGDRGLVLGYGYGGAAPPPWPTAGPAPTPPPPPGCAPAGHIVNSPDIGNSTGSFAAVAALSADDMWGVGSYDAVRGALIGHWDGHTWTRIDGRTTTVPGEDSALQAVAAVTSHDVWAAGTDLIGHWDGTNWAAVPFLPNPIPLNTRYDFNGMAARAAGDVWAAGELNYPNADNSARVVESLIMHWDGTHWSRVPSPNVAGAGGTVLRAIVALAPNDAWAVGDAEQNSVPTRPVAMHWDGQAWHLVDVPAAGDTSLLRGIAAAGPHDIWAVGGVEFRAQGVLTRQESLLVHWDGTAWHRLAAPNTGTQSTLNGVAVGAPSDVWAVGGASANGGPLALHWDGHTWSVAFSPAVSEYDTAFQSVAWVTGNDVWAVGAAGQTPLSVQFTSPCPAPGPALPLARVTDPHRPGVLYFPEVGHTLQGGFWTYWESHGGLAQFGYPISEEFQSYHGGYYTVQYFQRARFEWHPENRPPYDILLGLLGDETTTGKWNTIAFQPYPPPRDGAGLYFPQTHHTLAPQFLAYWQSHGGLPVYGYPISEAFMEVSATDGRQYLVQYFERNRLEYHPELPAPFQVSLGLLGVNSLQQLGWIP